MGISLSEQTAYFLWSLVLGLVLGILYDAVRMARMVLRAGRIHVMISDILFFTVCGILTSLFALPFNKGDVRGFILFGETAGFLVYRLTMGALMGKVYAFLARVLRCFVQKIRKILEIFFNYLLKAAGFLLYNIGVVIDKLNQKAAEKHRAKRAARVAAKQKQQKQRSHKGNIYEQKAYKRNAYRERYGTRRRAGTEQR